MTTRKKLCHQMCDPSEQPIERGGERFTLFMLREKIELTSGEVRRLLTECRVIDMYVDTHPNADNIMIDNLVVKGNMLLLQAANKLRRLSELIKNYEFDPRKVACSQRVYTNENINVKENDHGRDEDNIPSAVGPFGDVY